MASTSSTLSTAQQNINAALTVPECYRRKGVHRNYKNANYGVMTSEENIGMMRASSEADKQAEAEKQQRKLDREKTKVMNEKIRNMKKEKAVEKKEAKKRVIESTTGEPAIKKARGRPKKTA